MDLAAVTRSRHTVKAYAPGRQLPDALMQQLYAVLRNSPSSVNSQPWHYVVAASHEGRERIAAELDGPYAYNAAKLRNASHAIVLCMRSDLDEAHLREVLEQEDRDGRFRDADARAGQDRSRRGYVEQHRFDRRDVPQWMEKQVYLALGGLLLGAAVLGIDATPMEGFDPRAIDRALGLRDRGLTSVVLAALGYRGDDDFNAALPKSRLPAERIFTFI